MTIVKVRESVIEARLASRYADSPNVLSVRRQVRCGGGKRADIVVTKGRKGARCLTVIEVKSGRAGMGALTQLDGYATHLKSRVDNGTCIHAVIAAPAFAPELVAFVNEYDCTQCLRLELVP